MGTNLRVAVRPIHRTDVNVRNIFVRIQCRSRRIQYCARSVRNVFGWQRGDTYIVTTRALAYFLVSRTMRCFGKRRLPVAATHPSVAIAARRRQFVFSFNLPAAIRSPGRTECIPQWRLRTTDRTSLANNGARCLPFGYNIYNVSCFKVESKKHFTRRAFIRVGV